jgi:hypothetical protein
MHKRLITIAFTVSALAVASAAVAGGHPRHHGWAKHHGGWAQFHESCGAVPSTGSQAFVRGPGDPPAGRGSLEFRIGANGDSYETIRYRRLHGVKLSRLTELSYWTYVQRFGSGGQAPYLDLRIDNNNDGTADDTLTFEPVYQTSQGAVVLNTWQDWDAFTGLWWAESSGGPPPLFTLATYIASHPDARIVNTGGREGGFILSAGCGGAAWTNFVGNADKVRIGVDGRTRTFNFEPRSKVKSNKGKPHGHDKAKDKKHDKKHKVKHDHHSDD